MSWRLALVEDTDQDRQNLYNAVTRWSVQREVEVTLEAFTHPVELRDSFHRYDAFLLDVYMPGDLPEGWFLAERLRAADRYVPIIFVTGSEEHILSAFALQYVIDYIKKPVREEQLFKAMDNLLIYLSGREEEVFTCQTSFGSTDGERYQGVFRLPYRDLLFFRREKNSNYILINDNPEPRLRQSIRELLEDLPSHFLQADKSTVVNLTRIHQMHEDHVLFNDTARTRVEISAAYRQKLLRAYTQHRLNRVFTTLSD